MEATVYTKIYTTEVSKSYNKISEISRDKIIKLFDDLLTLRTYLTE